MSVVPEGGERVLVATRNPGKLRELQPMLRAAGFDPIDLAGAGVAPDPAEEELEVHESFEQNALAKARWFRERTGLATIADDSGLVVAALGGAPGVRSRRFSGRSDLRGSALDAANNALLLDRLEGEGEGEGDRRASFVCVAAFVSADGSRELVAEGRAEGRIVARGEGGGGEGFGYDPWFWSEDLGVTFGDASLEAKARVSHRGRAVRALLSRVAGVGEEG